MSRSFNESLSESGRSFTHFISDLALAPGGVIELLVRIGQDPERNTKLRARLTTDGVGLLEVFQNTVASANGTQVVSNPRVREQVTPSNVFTFENPTITDVGTPLDPVFTSSGSAQTMDWAGSAGKHYLFRATNLGAANARAVLSLDFVE